MSVYFAKVGEYVKVGYSANPEKRVQRLRSDDTGRPLDLDKSHPVELLRVVEGDSWDEHLAQAALRDFHVNGEWFTAESAVVDWINELDDGRGFPHMEREGGAYVHVTDAAGQARADAEISRLLERARTRRRRRT